MRYKTTIAVWITITTVFFTGFLASAQKIDKNQVIKNVQDTTKIDEVVVDSIKKTPEKLKLKILKKKVHVSYYANKFNGKRTSSGKRFDNKKYSAAHRKLPFGTRLRITNETNGKSVIVEVIDRGPFVRGREIDITRQAFMEIATNKNSGSAIVTIEEVVD